MSRAERLLDLIQVLRRHRHPVKGAVLAEATGVSLRTLYRDIELLKAEGAQIDGEANVNLVEAEGKRFPGSFGSAFMYFTVRRTILFREEHSRRVLVPKVDFVSAPGWSPRASSPSRRVSLPRHRAESCAPPGRWPGYRWCPHRWW